MPHLSAARMMLDGAFEPTGAAGKAQALTDMNDPSTIPEKASPEILVMIFSPSFYSTMTALAFLSSTNWKFIDRGYGGDVPPECLSSEVSPDNAGDGVSLA